ncbi:MAG: glycosyltransferase family 4 protein [Leptolyngbya sp. IPPAS B-1204]|uniref:Glycosyltransferase family 4 protein n=1 Tax=Leptolyngbya sp. NK1-12 TaxID=2547451 RepID=A0AA97APJ8_9CYAN|nr:glycosyltransferase family 4 protein [Leptolyngbya sp. NK1-12]MBF2048106.1 glycosyltransferase family 4 protein [Elainella sp. C42_A2020_010]RNJ70951.1 MAG: glycosyltransferase family 1 protein [Leptolyngbya sp. IPPAS B-1204]WNZ21738.1 glycosyltransferase family 4 protein [Leptolyngbya sp. NK1-12]
MHVAWLGKKSPFCGNVTYGREVTNALLDRGYQVSFLHFAQEDVVSDDWRDCQEVPIPFLYKSQIYTIPSLKSSKVLTQALRQLKPDLVHASLTLSPLDFLLPEICAELDIPLVATFHPPFARKPRNLTSGTQQLTYQVYAPFLANYDRVIVFSQIQQDLLVRFGVPKTRIAVIPNGVDPDKYSPGLSKLKTELNAQRIFVYQGRIAVEKNVESLLRAWKQAEMGEQSKLVIVGSGPLLPALMSTYGEEQGVIWLGFVADEQERIQLLRGADVFILPSLVEGLSLSLLEAMSCGLACIATDAGADGEVLEAGAGIVLTTQRVSAQLRTLLPLCQDHPELTALLGRKARQRVLDRYTLSRNITRLEELYTQVLQQHRLYSSTPV